jgi:hypothetical protein
LVTALEESWRASAPLQHPLRKGAKMRAIAQRRSESLSFILNYETPTCPFLHWSTLLSLSYALHRDHLDRVFATETRSLPPQVSTQ